MKRFLFGVFALSVSGFAVGVEWQGTTDPNLNNGSNWEGSAVPTASDNAVFDSTYPSVNFTPTLPTSASADFKVSSFVFSDTTSDYTFTINGPYSLDFFGVGIIGTNSHTTINVTYNGSMISGTTTSIQQLLFSQGTPTTRNATITVDLQSGGLITPSGRLNDIAQVLFDASGGANGGTVASPVITTIDGTSSLTLTNDGTIESNTSKFLNDLGQLVFDGSGGLSHGAAGTGNSEVNIGGSALILTTNSVSGVMFNQITSGSYAMNDMAQILFDGSGGASFIASSTGGSGQSVVNISDAVTLSAINHGQIYAQSDDGNGNDLGQIVFDGSSGMGYQSPGSGSSTVTISHSAAVSATNTANIYNAVDHSGCNDLGQIVFDGSCGFAFGATGASSYSSVMIENNASVTASNTGQIYNSAISANVNDIAQILFDGSAGFSSKGGGTGHSTVVIQDEATVTATSSGGAYLYSSSTGSSVSDSAAINDLAQILFDGSGGLGDTNQGTGNINVTIQDNTVVEATLASYMYFESYSYGNDVGQIVFDGSGGLSFVDTSNLGGVGNGTFIITGNAQVNAINNGGYIYLNTSSWANNLGQIIFDGSGGANYTATSSGGPGTGNAIVTIGLNAQISAVNDTNQILLNASTLANHMGQIIFDGSAGLNQTTFSEPSSGSLVVNVSGSAEISATNSGSILNEGSASGVAQILFDGSSNSIGTGSCTVNFTDSSSFTANNSGTIQGDQFSVYDTTLQGPSTFYAINTGTKTHGVAFYGSSAASTLNVVLTGSSLYIDPAIDSPFALNSVSFDSNSSYEVYLSPTTHTEITVQSATVGGSIALTQEPGTYAPTSKYVILNSANQINGVFNTTIIGGIPGNTPIITQTSNSIYLGFISPIPTDGLSGNALRIATAMNDSYDTVLLNYFEGLTGTALQEALNSVSPARNAFGAFANSQMTFGLSNLLSTYIEALRTEKKGSTALALFADAKGAVVPAPVKEQDKWSMWLTGFGDFSHNGALQQNPAFQFNSGGVMIGSKYRFCPQNFLGGALGYAYTHIHASHSMGHSNINYYFASLYGNGQMGDFYVSPAIWVFFDQDHNTRHVTVPDFSADARATIYTWQMDPHLELGYAFHPRNDIDATPFSSLDWVINWQRSYTEHGAAPFNAFQSSKQSSFVRSETGLKFSESWNPPWGIFTLKEKLSYVYEQPFGVGTINSGFVGSPTAFTVYAVNKNLNLGAVGLAAFFTIGKQRLTEIQLAYEGEFGAHFWTNNIYLNLSQSF